MQWGWASSKNRALACPSTMTRCQAGGRENSARSEHRANGGSARGARCVVQCTASLWEGVPAGFRFRLNRVRKPPPAGRRRRPPRLVPKCSLLQGRRRSNSIKKTRAAKVHMNRPCWPLTPLSLRAAPCHPLPARLHFRRSTSHAARPRQPQPADRRLQGGLAACTKYGGQLLLACGGHTVQRGTAGQPF